MMAWSESDVTYAITSGPKTATGIAIWYNSLLGNEHTADLGDSLVEGVVVEIVSLSIIPGKETSEGLALVKMENTSTREKGRICR